MTTTLKENPTSMKTIEREPSFLAAIVESSEDAILGMTIDGAVKSWNRGAEKMFGYTAQEVIGQPVTLLYPLERLEEHADILSKVKKGQHIQHYETQRKNKDGTIIDVSLSISPINNEAGEVIGFSKIIRDISAEKRGAGYARSLIEASVDSLVTISPEGKITDVNEATILVTGVSREKLIGTDFSDYFTAPEEARKGYKEVLSLGKVRDYPLSIRHISGKITDVLYNASVYKDNKGTVLGLFAAARDITAAKQALFYARSVIEAGLDPMITISPEGKITDVNEATVHITGVTREKLIGSDFIAYFTDPEEARQGYQQVFREGFIREYPLIIRHVSGTLTDVLYNGSVYKDDKGNVFGAIAAVRDITEQKKVEEKLHETSAYARSLIEASLDPLFIISPEGKISGVNFATEGVTGVTREWLIDSDFFTYFTEPHKAREGYRQVLKEGLVRNYPLSIHHASGKITDVSFNASVYKDAAGIVRGIFAVARDVTETKQLSQYARSLIEASRDPLVTISLEGKVMDVNEATTKITGVLREKIIGTDFLNYFSEPQKAREGYEQVFQKGFITDYPLTIRAQEGKLTDVLFNASVYKDDKGNVLGVTGVARDNTRTKQNTDETNLENKEMQAFSYSVSHDLRAPLRAISGFSKILVDEYSEPLGEEGRRIAGTILENTKQMDKLIEDLLDFSKIGSKKMAVEDVEMAEMAKLVFEELKKTAPERNVILHMQELPRARVDSALMKQVWVNLLSNAFKFTRNQKSATIDVVSVKEGEEMVYSVKDNGAGFDMKYVDKLFGVFQRLHSQEEFEGTGIGLGIAKRIIERHGGRMWAEGKVNEGATFYFTLPIIKII